VLICYTAHTATNDVAEERVHDVLDTVSEFLGYNFVSALRTLKPKKPLKLEKPKT